MNLREVRSFTITVGPQIRLLEDRREGLADRLALTSSQLAGAHTSLEAADGGREAMVYACLKTDFLWILQKGQ